MLLFALSFLEWHDLLMDFAGGPEAVKGDAGPDQVHVGLRIFNDAGRVGAVL